MVAARPGSRKNTGAGGMAIKQENAQYIQEIETIISQVQGVVSGRIVCQEDEILEIHVLANASRSPKQVVRDIESAVLVTLGVQLDHKKISVAQLDSGLSLPAEAENRFRFRSINYTAENGKAEIMITIDAGSSSHTAKLSGPNTRQNRLRLIAGATLSAVEKSLNIEGMLTVGEVQKVHFSGQNVIAAAVFLRLHNQEEVLIGTAINRGDELETAVRASLDAINRRLTIIKSN